MSNYHNELSQLIGKLIEHYQNANRDKESVQIAQVIRSCYRDLNHLMPKLEEEMEEQAIITADLKAQPNRRYENRDPALIEKYQKMAAKEVNPEYAFICALYDGLTEPVLSNLLKEVYDLDDMEIKRIRSRVSDSNQDKNRITKSG